MQKELTILTLLALLWAGCTISNKEKNAVAPVRVRTEVVRTGDYLSSARYVGVVEAESETPLSLQRAGRITAVCCRNGENVTQGRILLRIDSTQALNALRAAEAALKEAEDGYSRVKKVHGKGGVTDQKMVELESRLEQAKAMYSAAEKQLDECVMIAPCSGVVNRMELRPGQNVLPGERLMTVMNVSAYSARFRVPEKEIAGISVGQTGEMDCPATEECYPVTVTDKSIKAEPVAHTYEVTARIEGGKETLMPGMVGKVQLKSQGTHLAVVIPANCILMTPSGPTVWVVERKKASRRQVELGGYLAHGVRINAGLAQGDTLIVEGYQKLFQGADVEEIGS